MRILVAGWDSGGAVEAVQTVVRRAVARGHGARVLGTEGPRARFESAGAAFRRYRHAPGNDLRRPETDLVRDGETRNPLRLWVRARDRLLIGPAREFAAGCPRSPRYRAAAGRRASRLASERDDGLVVDELEHVARRAHATTGGQ